MRMRAQAVAVAVGRGAAETREAAEGGELAAGGATSPDRQTKVRTLPPLLLCRYSLSLLCLWSGCGFRFSFCFSFPFSAGVFAARPISLS